MNKLSAKTPASTGFNRLQPSVVSHHTSFIKTETALLHSFGYISSVTVSKACAKSKTAIVRICPTSEELQENNQNSRPGSVEDQQEDPCLYNTLRGYSTCQLCHAIRSIISGPKDNNRDLTECSIIGLYAHPRGVCHPLSKRHNHPEQNSAKGAKCQSGSGRDGSPACKVSLSY